MEWIGKQKHQSRFKSSTIARQSKREKVNRNNASTSVFRIQIERRDKIFTRKVSDALRHPQQHTIFPIGYASYAYAGPALRLHFRWGLPVVRGRHIGLFSDAQSSPVLIHFPRPNLSRCARHINEVYRQCCNKAHGCNVRLFRGGSKHLLLMPIAI
jgi:hypothetical protein